MMVKLEGKGGSFAASGTSLSRHAYFFSLLLISQTTHVLFRGTQPTFHRPFLLYFFLNKNRRNSGGKNWRSGYKVVQHTKLYCSSEINIIKYKWWRTKKFDLIKTGKKEMRLRWRMNGRKDCLILVDYSTVLEQECERLGTSHCCQSQKPTRLLLRSDSSRLIVWWWSDKLTPTVDTPNFSVYEWNGTTTPFNSNLYRWNQEYNKI
jgi:hypothetical protein